MSKGYYAIDKSGQLRHYKYVKREKKNGKWVYYYDDDLGGGKAVTTKQGHSTESMKAKNATKNAPKDDNYGNMNGVVGRVRDWLGYDEAVDANYAAKNYQRTADNVTKGRSDGSLKRHEANAKKSNEDYKKAVESVKANENYKPTSDSDRRHAANSKAAADKALESATGRKNINDELLANAKKEDQTRVAKMAEAGRKYQEAMDAYNKTPLAKIRNATGKAKEQIDKAKKAVQSWLDNLTKRLKKK